MLSVVLIIIFQYEYLLLTKSFNFIPRFPNCN